MRDQWSSCYNLDEVSLWHHLVVTVETYNINHSITTSYCN